MFSILKKLSVVFLFLILWSCQDESPANLVAPTNLQIDVAIQKGRTGYVTITPTAENVLNYEVFFGKDQESEVVIPGESITYRYKKSGKYAAEIKVVAHGVGGTSMSKVIELDMDVKLLIDLKTLQKIAGNGSKRWIWERGLGGHLGVGSIATKTPEFYRVPAGFLAPCVYDDVLVFSYDTNHNYTFELLTGEDKQSYINWAELTRFFPNINPTRNKDECKDISDQINTETNFSIYENEQGNQSLVVDNSMLSYWSGVEEYEIMELSERRLKVRGIQEVPLEHGGGVLAWYHTFVPENSIDTEYVGELPFETLVWADEFNKDGALDPSKWNYVLGDGCPDLCGWGNDELQTYTDYPSNVTKEDGMLKITAKSENGKYTSARINTKNLFDFVYGRVEVRAKLSAGVGNRPSIWMLGSNINKVGWPICGEVEIIEQISDRAGDLRSGLHFEKRYGKNGAFRRKQLGTASSEFHIYEMVWTAEKIVFSVDGTPHYTYEYDGDNPFDGESFYLLFNIGMVKSNGRKELDNTSSTMEVDYIRVYQ